MTHTIHNAPEMITPYALARLLSRGPLTTKAWEPRSGKFARVYWGDDYITINRDGDTVTVDYSNMPEELEGCWGNGLKRSTAKVADLYAPMIEDIKAKIAARG